MDKYSQYGHLPSAPATATLTPLTPSMSTLPPSMQTPPAQGQYQQRDVTSLTYAKPMMFGASDIAGFASFMAQQQTPPPTSLSQYSVTKREESAAQLTQETLVNNTFSNMAEALTQNASSLPMNHLFYYLQHATITVEMASGINSHCQVKLLEAKDFLLASEEGRGSYNTTLNLWHQKIKNNLVAQRVPRVTDQRVKEILIKAVNEFIQQIQSQGQGQGQGHQLEFQQKRAAEIIASSLTPAQQLLQELPVQFDSLGFTTDELVSASTFMATALIGEKTQGLALNNDFHKAYCFMSFQLQNTGLPINLNLSKAGNLSKMLGANKPLIQTLIAAGLHINHMPLALMSLPERDISYGRQGDILLEEAAVRASIDRQASHLWQQHKTNLIASPIVQNALATLHLYTHPQGNLNREDIATAPSKAQVAVPIRPKAVVPQPAASKSRIQLAAMTSKFNDFCKGLPIEKMKGALISNNVIDFHDSDEIRAERTEYRKTDYLLRKCVLPKLENNDVDILDRFISVMEGFLGAGHLANQLKSKIDELTNNPTEVNRILGKEK